MPLYALGDAQPKTPDTGRYWIAPDAQVIGNVILGDDVGIWFGAVLRGDNEPMTIGARTNIQDGVVIHSDPGAPATIGEGCTIGHRAIVHGCVIGDNSLVGMGAIMLNGSKIGNNCLVGAGALVTEGKSFPDNSMIVGSPARAIRTLDDKMIAMISGAANHYVKRSQEYAKGLKRIG